MTDEKLLRIRAWLNYYFPEDIITPRDIYCAPVMLLMYGGPEINIITPKHTDHGKANDKRAGAAPPTEPPAGQSD